MLLFSLPFHLFILAWVILHFHSICFRIFGLLHNSFDKFIRQDDEGDVLGLLIRLKTSLNTDDFEFFSDCGLVS